MNFDCFDILCRYVNVCRTEDGNIIVIHSGRFLRLVGTADFCFEDSFELNLVITTYHT